MIMGEKMAYLKIFGLSVNYLTEPCGIDEKPRFSYKVKSDVRGDVQVSRRICVWSDEERKNTVWDSGEVNTPDELLPNTPENLFYPLKILLHVYAQKSKRRQRIGIRNVCNGKAP